MEAQFITCIGLHPVQNNHSSDACVCESECIKPESVSKWKTEKTGKAKPRSWLRREETGVSVSVLQQSLHCFSYFGIAVLVAQWEINVYITYTDPSDFFLTSFASSQALAPFPLPLQPAQGSILYRIDHFVFLVTFSSK